MEILYGWTEIWAALALSLLSITAVPDADLLPKEIPEFVFHSVAGT